MTIHIGAKNDEIAETVLLPGDPMRAKWVAENFLTSPRLVNQVRGMFGYTGSFNGNRVTIQGSGMGMPSLSIYANELVKDYDVKTLIRIGSCGAMQPNINIRDIVIAQTNLWYVIPLFPMFVIFFISALAETNRPPFDLPEAEAVLVAGYQTEYSGMMYAMFWLGEYATFF